MTVIDVHAHTLAQGFAGLLNDQPEWAAEQARLRETFGLASSERNAELGRTVWRRAMTDLAARLSAMDAAAVDLQLVGLSPAQQHDWADLDLSHELGSVADDTLTHLVDAAPARVRALGWVPLQHPDLAGSRTTELMADERFAGVQIGTTAGPYTLDDRIIDPFWRAAEATGAIVVVHPWGCDLGSRLGRAYLANIVGNPIETTVALQQILFGGVLDRFPRLKIVAVHGGGYFAHSLGRADQAWRVRPESHATEHMPSTYRSQIYYDTVLHDPRELRILADAVGIDRLVLGTDYPFDMGVPEPHVLLEQAGFSGDERAAIAGRNLAALLERK